MSVLAIEIAIFVALVVNAAATGGVYFRLGQLISTVRDHNRRIEGLEKSHVKIFRPAL